MRMRNCTKVGLMVLFVVMAGLILSPNQALAQSQGDVAMKLAALPGLDSSNAQNAIAALTAAGIVLTWDPTASVTGAFTCSLYTAVNSAIETGKITPPSLVPNASALVAAAETAAGLSSTTVVNTIVSCGGNQAQASAGAPYGVSLGGAPPAGAGGFSAAPQGAAGGGGLGAGPRGGPGGGGGKPASPSR